MLRQSIIVGLSIFIASCGMGFGLEDPPPAENNQQEWINELPPVTLYPEPLPPIADLPIIVQPPFVSPPLIEPPDNGTGSPEPPPPPPPVEPPDDGTGMTEEEFNRRMVQQREMPPEYYRSRVRDYEMRQRMMSPPVVKIMGDQSEKILSLPILMPPKELTGCGRSFIFESIVPVVSESMQYRGWWLVAVGMPIGLPVSNMDLKLYFYWARQVSAKEVGAVYSGFATNMYDVETAPDAKIHFGKNPLPYQLVSHVTTYNFFPHMPNDTCLD